MIQPSQHVTCLLCRLVQSMHRATYITFSQSELRWFQDSDCHEAWYEQSK